MTLDYHAPEHVAERTRQADMRPHAEKLCTQYARGLMTVGDLIAELVALDAHTHAEEPFVLAYTQGWEEGKGSDWPDAL